MTNFVVTPNQTQGTCPDTYRHPGDVCDPKNNTCEDGTQTQRGSYTGRCVPANIPKNSTQEIYTCEVKGNF